MPFSNPLARLQSALIPVQRLIEAAVQRADEAGHDPTDALRGLIITRDEIESYLGQPDLAEADEDADFGVSLEPLEDRIAPDSPLARLTAAFDLSLIDLYILLISLAPELDRRYERLYAYLQDDVSLRYPTLNLVVNLLGGGSAERFAVWGRLEAPNPLTKFRLITFQGDANRPNATRLSQQLKVDQRIVDYLLGSSAPDDRLNGIVSPVRRTLSSPLPDSQMQAMHDALTSLPIIYLKGRRDTGQVETAAALCAGHRLPLLSIDLSRAGEGSLSNEQGYDLAIREGFLDAAALLFLHWDRVLDEQRHPPAALWQAILDYPLPIFIWGLRDWEPMDLERRRRMLRLDFATPQYAYRREMWDREARAGGSALDADDIAVLANKFRFTHAQIARAIQTAEDIAATRGDPPTLADYYAGAQRHASIELGHLATRVAVRMGWDELILPPDQIKQLREICDRMRYAHIVNESWGYSVRSDTGISALFAGESGTGKTLAAEVIAREMGLPLYKIDLSAVVSKYVGETEKNLSAIFDEAQAGSAILFFDEADALFGKRSEVKDAQDRYANIEVAYLLQRIESYDGIAILASNFRHNLDDAFTRRLDFIVDFPAPDAAYRRRIFEVHFPPNAPLASDVDLGEIAAKYRLSGGNIRNVALAAAYLAAADGRVITAAHIRDAVRRENQKMGRLPED